MADTIVRLKVESSEYDSKIKRAQQGLLALEESLKKTGKSFNDASQDQVAYTRALGQMATVSTTTKGKINELTSAFTELSLQYKRLTDEEKKGDYGRALQSSLDQLKGRINDAKGQLSEIGKELNTTAKEGNNLDSVLGMLGNKFGVNAEMLKGLTSGSIAYTAALGGLITAVAMATKEWAAYNDELAKQTQITTVTTGVGGDEADRITSAARAISKTYGVDFREVINAANTLMTQFGKSSTEALSVIRAGMQGMIQGDGPKLLSMIQQFAPSFRDAGVSASELVAVIQNSEGGLFTDQNMQAIVMGMRNIRLMTKGTSSALAQLGIDGQKMTQQLSDGSIDVFDALRQVASQLKNVDSNSQTAGQVMQAVFGRAGTMSGLKLAEAIETLNTNLTETQRQTGEVGESLSELERANERLENSFNKLLKVDKWDVFINKMKIEWVDTLNTVVQQAQGLVDMYEGIYDWLDRIGENNGFLKLATKVAQVVGPLANVYHTVEMIFDLVNGSDKATRPIPKGGGGPTNKRLGGAAAPTPIVTPAKTPKPKTTKTKTTPKAAEWDFDTAFPSNAVQGVGLSFGEQLAQEITNGMAMAMMQADTDTLKTLLETVIKNGITDINIPTDELMEKIVGEGMDIPDEYWQGLEDQINERLQELGIEPIKINLETGKIEKVKDDTKEMSKEWQQAGQAIQAVGNAMSAIEDPAAKVMGTIAQAVATMALSYAQASAAESKSGWGWIAFAATGLATMLSSIAAIKSATGGFEYGGIVPGNHYTGDNLHTTDYGINSGELVLTRAMQGNLASQLTGNGLGGMQLEAVVSGEQLRFVLNNNSRRRSKGEYVTTLMRN